MSDKQKRKLRRINEKLRELDEEIGETTGEEKLLVANKPINIWNDTYPRQLEMLKSENNTMEVEKARLLVEKDRLTRMIEGVRPRRLKLL